MELIEAAEYADTISYQSKQHSFFIQCLTAAFIDTQEMNIQELQYLFADYLEEDHDKIHGYYIDGKTIVSYLTPKQLNILVLLFRDRLTQREIAEATQINEVTVSVQIKSIRNKISKHTNLDWSI